MKTVREIRDGIAGGKLKAVDVVKAYLEKIAAEDDKIGSFLETFDSEALEAAEKIDAMVASGEELPRLAGVPIAIKDNILYKGHTASAGSKILENHRAAYTATALQRLLDAGVIVIGRTNMDEFAMGSSTETSFFKKTRNPVDTTKVPGGSSGGATAAVAAGFVPAALGSDTGGSVRQPASLCGVVGLKPSYGRISRYGLIAFGSSLDQIGPVAHTAEDCAMLLEVMEDLDPKDATTLDLDEKTVPEFMSPSFEGLKVGVPKEFFVEGMDPDVKKRVEEAIEKLTAAGAQVKEISLPLTEFGLAAYYIISPAEASSNLARFDGMRYGTRAQSDKLLESYVNARGEGFGDEVKRRIMLGTYILSAGYYDAYYKKAQAVRTAIHNEFREAFKEVDVIVGPTSPTVAWNMDEKFNDPIAMYLADAYTVTASMAGIPGISVPCGEAHGLPVGLQFLADIKNDAAVLNAAAAYQAISK